MAYLHSRQYRGQLGSVQLLSRHDPRNIIFLSSQHNPFVRQLESEGQDDKLTGSGHGVSLELEPSG